MHTIPGANSGIGFELVRLLAEKKHIVYLAARNETSGKEAQSKLHAEGLNNVKYIRIDVTDLATIQVAKETIDQAEGKLDVLVNNAGTFMPINISFTINDKLSFPCTRPRGNGNQLFWTHPNYHRFPSSVAQIDECCHTECLYRYGI